MRFRTHLLTSVLAGVALYPRRPARLAALVAAGTLVDLDHLLLYWLQTGDWSVVGALRYDRYRHRGAGAGDTRPRYGSLRSWLHEAWLVLPPLWLGAAGHPALRPAAVGLSLHLLLDHYDLPWRYAARRRAGGLCQGWLRAARPTERAPLWEARRSALQGALPGLRGAGGHAWFRGAGAGRAA
jgi:hypothetical protein